MRAGLSFDRINTERRKAIESTYFHAAVLIHFVHEDALILVLLYLQQTQKIGKN